MTSDVFFSVPNLLKKLPYTKYLSVLLVSCFSSVTLAAEEPVKALDLTQHWVGYAALVIFFVAYLLAMIEEVTELKKSKPMVFAASVI
jgi:TRAP-type C4-dicarboxylate transport system permease small subunit